MQLARRQRVSVFMCYAAGWKETGQCMGACRDSKVAFWLKLLAFSMILVTGVAGVSVPILYTRRSKALKSHGSLLSLVKCFAAGVILSTGFVHVLSEAFVALSSNYLPKCPWNDFPFSGMVAMVSALTALVIDILADRNSQTGPYIQVKSDDIQSKLKDVEMNKASVFPINFCNSEEEMNGGLALGVEGKKALGPPLEDLAEDLYVQQR